MNLLLIQIIIGQALSNKFCTTSACTTCSSENNFLNISCLSFCPHGYYLSQKSCVAIESRDIFILNLFSFRVFEANSIGPFSHPLKYGFNNETKVTPVVTIDRGLYFFSSSYLVSNTSWVLSPRFCAGAYFRALKPGVIFQVIEGNKTFFSITYNSTIQIQYLQTDGVQDFMQVFHLNYQNSWTPFLFILTQNSGNYYLYYNSFPTFIYSKEFRMDTNQALYQIGSINNSTFEGFLSYLCLKNSNECTFKLIPVSNCLFGQYVSSQGCSNCLSNCTSFPFCTRSSCNLCHSNQCSRCKGHMLDYCETCDDPNLETCQTGKNCLTGSGFNCSQCKAGFNLINGLCLLPISNFSSIILRMDYFTEFQGGYFQSGSNSSTYSPFNNPEDDDPVALNNRGYFFNYTHFMKADNITLNYTFTVVMWATTGSANIIACNKFSFRYDSSLIFTLANSEKSLKEAAIGECYSSTWKLFGVIVDFSNNSTHVNFICKNVIIGKQSISGYAFYDSPGIINITTQNSTSTYIYRIAFFQYPEYDFITILTICSSPGSASCLGLPNYLYYNNSLTKSAVLCSPLCTQGCSTWGTCNKCSDIRCSVCENFNTSCVPDSNFSACLPGFQIAENNKTCCNERCVACYGETSYLCTKCSQGYVMVGTLCTFNCPSRYTLNLTTCVPPSNRCLMNVTFNLISDTFKDSFNNQFVTGADEKFYPVPGENDPIPASSRGFYFNGKSFLNTSNIAIPNNFTFLFWMRQTSVGVLISKETFTVTTNVTILLKQTTMYFPQVKSGSWVSWRIFGFVYSDFYYIQVYDSTGTSASFTSNLVFDDPFSPIRIGSAVGGFAGFIWRMTLFAEKNSSFSTINVCLNSAMIDCLWDCPIQSFYANSTCVPCSQSCSQGCVRNSDCNLCLDPLCYNCSYFNTSCNSCKENSTKTVLCECNSGFYWNSSEEKCMECMRNCLQCASIQSCSVCKPNSIFNGTSCVCSAGFYLGNQGCLACNQSCKTCFGPSFNQCESCFNTQILVNNGCVCPQGYYVKGLFCLTCASYCLECKSSSTCLRCSQGFSLINSSCTCPDGTFLLNGKCEPCDNSCRSCSGSLENECLSCKANLVLATNHSCICPINTFLLNNYCNPCHSLCGSCSGTLETDCQTCIANLVLATNHSCICPISTFLLNNYCSPCHSMCGSCSGNSETDCLTCIGNLVLASNHSCACPISTFLSNKYCNPCHSLCGSCSGNLETDCLTCTGNLVLATNHSCICPANTFLSNNYCTPCNSMCASCSGNLETDCLTCIGNLVQAINHSCICPINTFLSNNYCSPCYSLCKSCSGNSETDCLTCIGNLVLATNRSCICPMKTFLSNNYCSPCYLLCGTCRGTLETDCLTCIGNLVLTSNNSCVCPINTFLLNNYCNPCHSLCETCTGYSEIDCLTCIGNLVLANNHSCICPMNTFLSNNYCSPCHSLCGSCSGNLETDCLTCIGNLELTTNHSCICPINNFLSNNYCSPCHSLCRSCSGTLDTDCLTCVGNLVLASNNSCICPIYTFRSSNYCNPCHSLCESCSGTLQTDCLTCIGNLVLATNHSCICPINTFLLNNYCSPCHSLCGICSGNSETDCLTCIGNLVLASNNLCICPMNTFLSNNYCSPCHSLCGSCSGALETDCQTCIGNLVLATNHSCICPINTFMSNNYCNPCHSLCGSCSGTLETDCLTCIGNLVLAANHSCICPINTFLLNNYCNPCHSLCGSCSGNLDTNCQTCIGNLVLTSNNSCICPIDTFLSGDYCKACYFLCGSCSGELATDCLSCKESLILMSNNSCACPINTFLLYNLCVPCSSYCETCSGGLETDCLSCKGNLLLKSNNSCMCPNNTFLSSDYCKPCELLCESCSGELKTDCIACKETLVMASNHSCICPDKTFLLYDRCIPCSNLCETCSGSSENECLSCIGNLILSESKACKCPPLSFLSMNQCDPCYELCESCAGTSETDCLSCQGNLVLSNISSCTCPAQMFLTNKNCEPCHDLCKDCKGPLPSDCLSCISNLILSENNSCICNNNYYLKNKTCHFCDPSLLLESTINNCTCKAFHYWNTSQCMPCHDSCQICKGSTPAECLECKPKLTFDSEGFCLCPPPYYWSGTECLLCDDDSHLTAGKYECLCEERFFNNSGKCQECPNLCILCSNSSHCLKCEEFGFLLNNDSCSCLFGYEEKLGKCLKLYFSVDIKILEEDKVSFSFQADLLKPLNITDVNFTINSFLVKASIEIETSRIYHAKILIPEHLKNLKGRQLLIEFMSNITSTLGASLKTLNQKLMMPDYVPDQIIENLETLQNTGKTLTTAAAAAAFTSGAILMNPTMIFNLLNLVEMYSYSLLFDVKFHEKFVEFILSLKQTSKIPSVQLPIKTTEQDLPKKFGVYGINSSLFIENGGIVAAFLVLTSFIAVLSHFLSSYVRHRRLKSFFLKLKKTVYFQWFFRICIQSCFDFGVFTLLSLRYSDCNGFIYFLETISSILAIIFVLICFVIYSILIMKIKFPQTSKELEIFIPYFSSLFEEFNTESWNNCLFYLIFLTRRILLSVLIIFSNGIIQLMAGISFCLMMIFYLGLVKPFKEYSANIILLVNEMLLLLFYGSVTVNILGIVDTGLDDIATFAIKVIIINLVMNILTNIIQTFTKVVNFLRSKLCKKSDKINPIADTTFVFGIGKDTKN